MNDVVPTSDSEEEMELNVLHLAIPAAATTVYSALLNVQIPAKKRRRSTPPIEQAPSPSSLSSSTRQSAVATRSLPFSDDEADVKKEELQELNIFNSEETPERDTTTPSPSSFPPASMTPVSGAGRDSSSPGPSDFPMEIDHDAAHDAQHSTPSLTPDRDQDDLMNFPNDTDIVSQERPTTPPADIPTSPTTSPQSTNPLPAVALLNLAPLEAMVQQHAQSRYPMRNRGVHQIMPYTMEAGAYNHQLKDYSEARFNSKNIQANPRVHARHEADDIYHSDDPSGSSHPSGRRSHSRAQDGRRNSSPRPRKTKGNRREEERQRSQDAEDVRGRRSTSKQILPVDAFRALSLSPTKRTRVSTQSSRVVRSPSASPTGGPPSPPQRIPVDLFDHDSPPSSQDSLPALPAEDDVEIHVASSSDETSDNEPDEVPEAQEQDSEQIRILKKMYPAFMLTKVLMKAKAKAKGRGKQVQRKKLKKQIAHPPRDRSVSRIVGDPESSDDARHVSQTIDPQDDLLHFEKASTSSKLKANSSKVQPEKRDVVVDVIDISDDDSGGDSSDGEDDRADPGDARYYSEVDESSDVEEEGEWALMGKEPDAIDYMLVRAVRSKQKKSSTTHERRHGTSHRRASGIGGRGGGTGASNKSKGRQKQTKLTDFGGHSQSVRVGTKSKGRVVERFLSVDDDEENNNERRYHKLTDKQQAWEQLKKKKKAQKKRNGIVTLPAAGGTHIKNGATRIPRSADLELEDVITGPRITERDLFRYSKATTTLAPATKQKSQLLEAVFIDDIAHRPTLRRQFKDVTFSPKTYIGKGLLFELAGYSVPGASVVKPTAVEVHDIAFSPEMSSMQFLENLDKFWSTLFEAITGLPDDANDFILRSSNRLCRAASLLLSHLLQSTESDLHLRARIEEQVTRWLVQMRTPEFDNTTTDETLWALMWLPIELGVRIGLPKPTSASDGTCLGAAVGLLVSRLTRQTMQIPEEPIDRSFHPLELWICLFNVFPSGSEKEAHVIWQFVEQALTPKDDVEMKPLDMSERMWSTINGLADLSLFSVHGRYMQDAAPSPGWNLVLLALQSISLIETKDDLPTSGFRTLARRDRYVASLIRRCIRLYSVRHWSLVGVSAVLQYLLQTVFKTRNFASLMHEGHDYPQFVLHRKWDDFSTFGGKDSAYTFLLKFVIQALPALPKVARRQISSSFVATAQFHHDSLHPTNRDLSALTNRFVGILATIYAEPDQFKVRIAQAHGYIDFKSADDNTRWVAIQGFTFLCLMLVHCNQPLDSMAGWLGEIIDALLKDCTTRTQTHEHPFYNVTMLTRGMGYIFSAYHDANVRAIQSNKRPCYPSVDILSKMQPVGRNRSLRKGQDSDDEDVLQVDFVRMYHAFFHARSSCVPPSIQPIENVESQDAMFQEFDDFDLYEEPKVPAVAEDYEEWDRAVTPFLQQNLYSFAQFCTSSLATRNLLRDIDRWIKTWAISAVLVASAKKQSLAASWKSVTDRLTNAELDKTSFKNRAVYHILTNDPEAYTIREIGALASELTWQALGAAKIKTEHTDLMAVVLDIDHRQDHHKFPDVPFSRTQDGLRYDISASDWEDNREDMLASMLVSTNDGYMRSYDRKGLMEPLISMFSLMRDSYNALGDDEVASQYRSFCRFVINKTRAQANICSDPGMTFWKEWFQQVAP